MTADVLALLVAFQVKHLAADYFLQGRYMLGKFRPGWDFALPLLAHAGVHATLTFAIALVSSGRVGLAVSLAVADGAVHFVVDRVKAGPKYLGRFSDKNTPAFWWCLGADQTAHHLTHYALIATLV